MKNDLFRTPHSKQSNYKQKHAHRSYSNSNIGKLLDLPIRDVRKFPLRRFLPIFPFSCYFSSTVSREDKPTSESSTIVWPLQYLLRNYDYRTKTECSDHASNHSKSQPLLLYCSRVTFISLQLLLCCHLSLYRQLCSAYCSCSFSFSICSRSRSTVH